MKISAKGNEPVMAYIILLLYDHSHFIVIYVQSWKKTQVMKKTFSDMKKKNLEIVNAKDVALENICINFYFLFKIIINISLFINHNIKIIKKNLKKFAIIRKTAFLKDIQKFTPKTKRFV